MNEHQYFTVDSTALTIPDRGALAIYCGDAPRTNPDGSVSHCMRAPLLIMPPYMFQHADVEMGKVAYALNKHAALFYPSAAPSLSAAMQQPEVQALVAATRRQIENVERWLETGTPAGPDESKSIYDAMTSALAPFIAVKEASHG